MFKVPGARFKVHDVSKRNRVHLSGFTGINYVCGNLIFELFILLVLGSKPSSKYVVQ